jgi:hypothetical protein
MKQTNGALGYKPITLGVGHTLPGHQQTGVLRPRCARPMCSRTVTGSLGILAAGSVPDNLVDLSLKVGLGCSDESSEGKPFCCQISRFGV